MFFRGRSVIMYMFKEQVDFYSLEVKVELSVKRLKLEWVYFFFIDFLLVDLCFQFEVQLQKFIKLNRVVKKCLYLKKERGVFWKEGLVFFFKLSGNLDDFWSLVLRLMLINRRSNMSIDIQVLNEGSIMNGRNKIYMQFRYNIFLRKNLGYKNLSQLYDQCF